jgi:hypothetical protein
MRKNNELRFRKSTMEISEQKKEEFKTFINSELPTLNLSRSVDVETAEKCSARMWLKKVMKNCKSVFNDYELEHIVEAFSNTDNYKVVLDNIAEDLKYFKNLKDKDVEEMVIENIKIMAMGIGAV